MLIVICGATATGKSGLALALAQRCNSIIISADSRQVYREFNIGTAKPTIAEQKLVPHYLIDICNPSYTMTVADYQQQVQRILGQRISGQRLEVKGQRLEIAPLVPRISQSPHLFSRWYWTVY